MEENSKQNYSEDLVNKDPSASPISQSVDYIVSGDSGAGVNNEPNAAVITGHASKYDFKHFNFTKVFHTIGLVLAGLVIFSFIFNIQGLGMFSTAAVFLIGIIGVAKSVVVSVITKYKSGHFAGAVIFGLLGITALLLLGNVLVVGFFIITLMLGFWELNT